MLQGAGNDLEFLILPPLTPGASVVGAPVCVRARTSTCAGGWQQLPALITSLYIEAACVSR